MKRTPFLIALSNPINLAMLGLIVAAGLCSAWWLAPIGLALWIVMMLIIAREPTLQFSHVMDKRAPLASRFQSQFTQINRSHTRVFNAIIGSKNQIRRELRPILQTSSDLVDSVYDLCLRLTPMENNRLVVQSTGGLLLQLENMQVKIDNAEDPIVKREYRQAYDSLKEQAEQNRRFSSKLERLEAQLVSLKSDLDNLHSRIVSLQSKSPSEVRQEVHGITSELEEDLAAFESFKDDISV
jgi:archaellum component FlaC